MQQTRSNLVVGSAALRDAFYYGRPGRYRIALASMRLFALIWGQIAHRDVTLSWMARSVWYALTPVLALPPIVGVARGELSVAGLCVRCCLLPWCYLPTSGAEVSGT